MLFTFRDQMVVHFLVGVSIAFLIGLVARRGGRRRYMFHFMGDSPFSIGLKRYWVLWYAVALTFEIVTSFLTHSLYVEIGLSIFQAVAFTVGTFVVDRGFMMFEYPQLYPQGTNTAVSPTTVTIETKPTTIESAPKDNQKELPPAQPALSDGWLASKLKGLVKNTIKAPGFVLDNISQAIEERSAEKRQKQEEKNAVAQEGETIAKEGRKNRLGDLTDKY